MSFVSLVLIVVGLYVIYMILNQMNHALRFAKYFAIVSSPVFLVDLVKMLL